MSDNPQVTFLKKVYSILTATEGAAPDAGPMNPIYVAFCTPGIPLPVKALNFDPQTKDGIQNLAQWSQLVNTIPSIQSNSPLSPQYSSSQGTWNASGNKLDNIYEDFLNGAKANLPELTDHEKTMHDKAMKYLQTEIKQSDPFDDTKPPVTRTVESDAYTAYKKAKKAYDNALMAYSTARLTALTSSDPAAKALFAVQGANLQNNIISCFDDWVASGNKSYVEEALDILANLSGNSFVAQLKQAKADFNSNALTDPILGKFYPTPPVPIQFFEDPADSSWTTYYYDHTETDKYNNVSSAHIGGSTSSLFSSLELFGFNIGGGADMSFNAQTVQLDEDTWKVKFDLVQLPLARGWFRFDLLNSKAWFWDKQATEYGNLISVGHVPLQKSEQPLMPIYPTSVLLVRNVEITTKTQKLRYAVSKFDESVDVHIGWGPFNLGSIKQNVDNETSSNHVSVDENGLKSDGIAILGFICGIIQNKLPQGSPNQ